jgi:hypothetical protein
VKGKAVCLPFILARGLLWFLPEQSRTNGREKKVSHHYRERTSSSK